jgi:hypothetical protein
MVLAVVWIAALIIGSMPSSAQLSGQGTGRSAAVEGQDNDIQNNDDFSTAQTFTSGDFLDGTTGMDDPHRIDTYVLHDVPTGKVVNASLQIINFDGRPGQGQALQLTGWNRHHTDALAWSNREDNPDRRPWEAVSFLCVITGDYYLQLKPIAGQGKITYRLHIQYFDPEDITSKIGTGGAFGATITGQVSSYKWYPGHWYKLTLDGEQAVGGCTMNDYLYVNMTEPGAPDQRLWGDIYVRSLEPESWSYWLNQSWWLDSFVQYEEVHAAACHPGPSTYYLDIQAYNTSGGRSENYELRLTKTLVESDGDNHPLDAAAVTFDDGKSTVRRTGDVRRGEDMFDWYKVHLKQGRGVSANLTLTEKSSAIFRLSIYRDNLTGGYDLMSSWTNKPVDTVLNRVNALTSNVTQEGWYYIGVIAQIGLLPGNSSNLADWTAQTAWAKYNLDLTTCPPMYSPSVRNPPAPIVVSEDASDRSLELRFTGNNSGVFWEQGEDGIYKGPMTYSASATPGLQVAIDGGSPEAPATITPDRNWNGEADITFTAADPYGRTCSTAVHVTVTPVNDPPFVKIGIPDFTVFEGSVNNTMKDIDLFAVFGDPDFPPYGEDKLTFSVDESLFPAAVTDDKLTFGPAPSFPGKDGHFATVTVTATDRSGLTASLKVNITIINLCHPPHYCEENNKIEILEDTVSYFDLHILFTDPDSDPVSFVYLGGATENLTVEMAPNGTAILTPARNYFAAQEMLRFKCHDTQGLNRTGELIVRIRNVPDPPEPGASGLVPDPLEEIQVDEGAAITFRVFATDVDTKTSALTYTWYLDGAEKTKLGATSYTWRPSFDDAGPHVVSVRVGDGTGFFDAEWKLMVINVNRAPVVQDLWPLNNTEVSTSAKITFRVSAHDPDGDPMMFFWRLSDGRLLHAGTGKNSSTFSRCLAPGHHIVVLEVQDDQGGVVRQYIYVNVGHSGDPPIELPWAWIWGLSATLILIAATASFRRRKRR